MNARRTPMDKVDALMAALTLTIAGSHVIAPHLRLLAIACSEDHYIDHGPFVEMLKSRRQVTHCALETAGLLIESGPSPSSGTLRDLDTLRQEGLYFFLLEGQAAFRQMIVVLTPTIFLYRIGEPIDFVGYLAAKSFK
jgi:hypothetical protein